MCEILQFPEDFFREEVRLGFTISQTMKCAWAAQMEVLQKIMSICEKYNLSCYAFWGTLLGAVRHEGFIPWDDDIDIAIIRDDYMKFLRVARDELPSEYCILNVYTEEEYTNTFTRITNNHTIDISAARLSQYHGCPFVVGIDIFPLDYIPRDAELAATQKNLLSIIGSLTPLAVYIKEQKRNEDRTLTMRENEKVLEEGISSLEKYCNVSINRSGSIENQLRKLYDRICMIYGAEDSDILTSYPEYVSQKGFMLKKEWFDSTTQLKFENITLTVPSGYDQILKALFGDYMTPVRGSADHEYPFYANQLRALHERGLWLNVRE